MGEKKKRKGKKETQKACQAAPAVCGHPCSACPAFLCDLSDKKHRGHRQQPVYGG